MTHKLHVRNIGNKFSTPNGELFECTVDKDNTLPEQKDPNNYVEELKNYTFGKYQLKCEGHPKSSLDVPSMST